jgi:hypothetical protein
MRLWARTYSAASVSICTGARAPLGEHLLRGLGQRTLGAVENGLGTAGDGGTVGDGGGGTPEWPGRVGA